MSGITAKQEKFVQGVVSGLSQREAYKQAYNASNMKDATIDNNAYKLMQNDEILTRYQELVAEYKTKTLWTRERAEEELSWLMEKAKQDLNEQGFRQANSTAFLNAIKELNEIGVVYPMREKQIAKMDNDMNKSDSAEDKLSDYLAALGGAIDGS